MAFWSYLAIVLMTGYSPVVSKGPVAHRLPLYGDTVGYSLNLQKGPVRIILDVDGIAILISGLGNLELALIGLDDLSSLGIVGISTKLSGELLACAADHAIDGEPVVVELVALAVLSLSYL